MVLCRSAELQSNLTEATGRLGLAKSITSSLLDIPLWIIRSCVEKRRDEIL
jgi:hypothetical protein